MSHARGLYCRLRHVELRTCGEAKAFDPAQWEGTVLLYYGCSRQAFAYWPNFWLLHILTGHNCLECLALLQVWWGLQHITPRTPNSLGDGALCNFNYCLGIIIITPHLALTIAQRSDIRHCVLRHSEPWNLKGVCTPGKTYTRRSCRKSTRIYGE